jgi:hypothetical protein
MKEVGERYGVLLNLGERIQSGAGLLFGSGIPEGWNELAAIWKHPDIPSNVIIGDYGDLDLLPDRASQGTLQTLRKSVEEWRTKGPGAPPRAHALQDTSEPFKPRVFIRGNPNQLGVEVPRRFVSMLNPKPFTQGSGRLELAQSIIHPDNPLTARVIVNRLWAAHFGQGFVSTPGDFGLRSDPPSHPELLDYLARDFMNRGWSLKQLHRQILLSGTYQQISMNRDDLRRVDPENRLLGRMNRRRLDWEGTRDSLLFLANRWDRKLGGSSIRNPLDLNSTRRTLYTHLDRLNVPGLFRTFDFPSPDATNPQRDLTTVPPQALFWMNHPFVESISRQIATRPEIQGESDPSKKIEALYRLLFARLPTEAERKLGERFVAKSANDPWPKYVHALLQSNELSFLD